MADQEQKQYPHQQHQFTDREKHALTLLGPMLGGGLSEEDEEFEERIREHEEANAAKMRAARTGGSVGLGPTEAEQALAKQQQTLHQQAMAQAQQAAQQAQSQEPLSPTPPPAPTGPEGVTTPFPAQKGQAAAPGGGQPPPVSNGGAQQQQPEQEEQS